MMRDLMNSIDEKKKSYGQKFAERLMAEEDVDTEMGEMMSIKRGVRNLKLKKIKPIKFKKFEKKEPLTKDTKNTLLHKVVTSVKDIFGINKNEEE